MISMSLGLGYSGEPHLTEFHPGAWETTKLTEGSLPGIIAETEKQFKQVSAILVAD